MVRALLSQAGCRRCPYTGARGYCRTYRQLILQRSCTEERCTEGDVRVRLRGKTTGMKAVAHGWHNASPVNTLKQAWEWNDWIAEAKITSIQELSEKLGISRRYVDRVLNIRYLSPKIQLMILKGTQPANWTTHTFMKALPSDWAEQEKELNI